MNLTMQLILDLAQSDEKDWLDNPSYKDALEKFKKQGEVER